MSKPTPLINTTWQCYILRCADDTLYTGVTNNLAKRFASHNMGTAAKYTRSRLPVSLVFTENHPDQSSALKREIMIKKLPRLKKLLLIKQTNRNNLKSPSPPNEPPQIAR